MGPADPKIFRPYSKLVKVIKTSEELKCMPCIRPGGKYGCLEQPCMSEINPETIVREIKEMKPEIQGNYTTEKSDISNKKIPNFFIIGAPKSGTTSLSSYLRENAEIFISEIKEPDYFDFDLSAKTKMTLDYYLSLFSEANPNIHKAVGEASTSYLYSKCAVEEILKFNPDSKFIVMLRNPLDFVQSLHSHHYFYGVENIKDFEKAWRAESRRKNGRDIPFTSLEPKLLYYSEWGKFGEQIERLFSCAKRENIKVIIFDDFVKNTKEIYEEVLQFLNVKSGNKMFFPIINEGKSLRLPWLQRILSFFIYRGLIVRKNLGIIRKDLGLSKKLLSLNSKPLEKNPLNASFKRELIEFYRDDVIKLSKLLNRDLSHWVATSGKDD
jgi:hypothetical protein